MEHILQHHGNFFDLCPGESMSEVLISVTMVSIWTILNDEDKKKLLDYKQRKKKEKESTLFCEELKKETHEDRTTKKLD